MRERIERVLHDIRWLTFTSYFLQAASALVGAMCLYAAIDSFLRDMPTWSALQTAIAYWNGRNFVEQAAMRARLRGMWREIDG